MKFDLQGLDKSAVRIEQTVGAQGEKGQKDDEPSVGQA
jgi:hypothetical protein